MAEKNDSTIIQCSCGQKLRIPAEATAKTFKCVRCGELIPAPGRQSAAGTEAAGSEDAQEPIGQMLVEEGLVSPEQLDEVLSLQQEKGGKTFELLVDKGYLDREELHRFLSKQPGVATIDLSRVSIGRDLTELVPRELALESLVLPIDQLGKLLTVAMACPLDTRTIRSLEERTGLRVKAMLCKLNDIHAAVQRYYPLEAGEEGQMATYELPPGMLESAKEDVTAKVAAIDNLGCFADVSDRLLEVFLGGEPALEDITAVLRMDPRLGAAVLRAANGAAYGLAGKVDSVAMAVALLGPKGVRAIADQCLAKEAAPGDLHLSRAQYCAGVAEALARAAGRPGPALAHTAGLLHELGCLALDQVAHEKYSRVDAALGGSALVVAEKGIFTMGHTEAGGSLAARWRWPDSLCLTLRHYLDPEQAGSARTLASILQLASLAASLSGRANAESFGPAKEALAHSGITAVQAADCAQTVPFREGGAP